MINISLAQLEISFDIRTYQVSRFISWWKKLFASAERMQVYDPETRLHLHTMRANIIKYPFIILSPLTHHLVRCLKTNKTW